MRLAWLPLDGLARPQVAAGFNQQLEAFRLPDVDRHTRAPVSMEVAQLSIECIQPEPRCYQAVGRQLQVERLLWAEVTSPPAPKRNGPLKATVVLFDVERMVELHRVQQEFAGPDAAVAGFAALLQETAAAVGAAPVANGRPAPSP